MIAIYPIIFPAIEEEFQCDLTFMRGIKYVKRLDDAEQLPRADELQTLEGELLSKFVESMPEVHLDHDRANNVDTSS